jgi:hypothetical protein
MQQIFSAMLPSSGTRKFLANSQVQGIVVAPPAVEVWGIGPRKQEGKAIYSIKQECHNSSYLCTKQFKHVCEVMVVMLL